jgi:Periplasmic protein TonB, links inner and outer membranes
MGGLVSNLILPIKAAYIRLFEINKYFAVLVLSVSTTFFLFVLMVTLISLGDSGLKEDKSVKLADIVMPEREIDTFMDEVDKPDEPEEQPEDIAQPEVDLQPTTGIDVNIPKPKAKFTAGGSFFRDGEYIPLFKIQPQYPRRAQERGTMGFAIVAFTITESGTIEDVVPVEGYCTSKNPNDPEAQLRPCSIFNSASSRAALKLKYKPKIVDGKAY